LTEIFINQISTLSTKVFVTGGTGFLGAYVIKELVEKGFAVSALRRSNKLPSFIADMIFEQVSWIDGDIFDVTALEEAMEDANIVIHAAAKVSFVSSQKATLFKTNIEGTANVVNAAIACQVPRFIHVSSVAAIGRTKSSDRVNETKEWEDNKSNTNYAVSKHLAEMEVWRGVGEGLNTVIVNPSTIIGFGDWNTSSCAIFKSVYQEFPWYTDGVKGFVDVEDVARLIVMLSKADIQAERFILNTENISIHKLFDLIADGFGKKRPSWRATPLLAEFAWRAEKIKSLLTGKDPILTKESAKIAQQSTYYDAAKIKKALPDFSFTPLEKTVASACKSYLNAL
jgi:dihydroflavonol-4-reductase